MSDVSGLKRDIFYRLLEMAGRVFIIVRHGESVSIGGRGFLDEEKANGLVLVFNKRMNFIWDETGLHASLVFGSSAEKCHIPPESIIAVYSPELNAQFVVMADDKIDARAGMEQHKPESLHSQSGKDNVIKVDFHKK